MKIEEKAPTSTKIKEQSEVKVDVPDAEGVKLQDSTPTYSEITEHSEVAVDDNKDEEIDENAAEKEDMREFEELVGMSVEEFCKEDIPEHQIIFDLYVRREIPNVDGVYIKGAIQGVEVVYTVDTGASITLLSKKIFDQIPRNEKPSLHPKVPILKNADGKRIQCFGSTDIEMMLGPLYVEKKVVVAEITDDVLLGADIMLGDEAGPADLLFSKNVMYFRNAEIPIEIAGKIPTIRTIRLADNYKRTCDSECH